MNAPKGTGPGERVEWNRLLAMRHGTMLFWPDWLHLGDIERIPVAVWANPAEPGFCPAAAPMPGSPIAAPPPTSTGPILWRNNVSDGAFRQSAQQPVAPKRDGDAVD